MADQEEDFSQLPLPDRFQHKNWKVRKEGYEAAVKEFEQTTDESDPVFKQFLYEPSLWKGAAADSNVAAQQEGLAALCAFLKGAGRDAASKTRGLTVTPIWEKGLSSRPAAKASALEALMLYVELDRSDALIEEMLPAMSHKQPKVIAATLNAITALYHAYGIKIIDPKPVLKVLAKPFGHADKNVRAEGSNLAVELYRWLKDALKGANFWNDLKSMQQQDLEKLFEKIKEEPAPQQERFTRTQQAAMAAAEEAGKAPAEEEAAGEEDEDVEEAEVPDLAEPIDVFPKIPKDLHENLASTKWKDRKDALDALSAVLDTPKIKDGPYDEIVRAFAKCMKDANIMVVITAANCTEKLANGLRKGFSKYRSTILSPMMERLKEKKQSVADALGAALDAVFNSSSLSDCLEEIIGFLSNKNPQVKLESTRFLIRCLKNTRDVPGKEEVKTIAETATKTLADPQETTRSAGAEVLGTLMKIMGEKPMAPYMEPLDDIRKTRIKEIFDTAEVKAKNRPKPVAPPPKAAPPATKRAAPGGKRPAAKKPAAKPAPPPSPPPVEPPTPQPKPTAKALPKAGGLQKPGAGLKAPAGLKRPGMAPSALSSPRRVISPPTAMEEELPATPSAGTSRFGGGRPGGLTGRPLGKPSFTGTSAESSSVPPAPAGMTAVERAEMEELRLEKDRLTKLTDDLRSSNTKLTAEVSELQNQNAQLIEDHTRDVLQIKAKETQLVRARGENDVLRSEIDTVRKDNDRMKREVGRLGRESLGRDTLSNSGQDIYEDGNGNGGAVNGTSSSSAAVRPPPMTLPRTTSTASAASSSAGRPRSYLLSPSEEKENSITDNPMSTAGRRKISPPVAMNGVSGRSSPDRSQRPGIGSRLATGVSTTSDRGDGETRGGGEPAENWKRAAEVTSQLKARIEQMKARQGLNRGH